MTQRLAVFVRVYWLPLSAVFLATQVGALWWFGQPALCECGQVSLWANEPLSVENSQQFFDWYSFSHVIHGVLFFYLARRLFPQAGARVWFVLALMLEVGWEVLENTPLVIEHYRQQALAVGYTGDSILNSVMDTLAMAAGFVLAQKWRWQVVVVFAVVLEGLSLYMIRDGLALNLLGFFHQFEFISNWQNGG